MRPADFLMLGAVLATSGLIGVKLERILAKVSNRDLHVLEANAAALVSITGAILLAIGVVRTIF